jgi:ABC-type branched-subunit amino acid transport system substrate-binding protein
MKNKYIGVLLLIIIVLGGVYVYSHKKADSTLKIGVILPITGKAAALGEASNKLMELAREDLAAAYPNNHVEIIVEDGGGDAKASVAAAQKLVEVDKVNALYVALTAPTLATLPIAQKAGIVFGHSTFTDVPLTTYDKALKTFIDYRDLCEKQGSSFTSKGYTKVVSMSENNGLAEICADSLAKTFKGEVKIMNLSADTDVKTEMLKLKKDAFQAIVNVAYEPNTAKVIKAMNELAYKPDLVCNIATCATQNMLKTFTTSELSSVIIHSTGVKEEFEKRYIAKYGSKPSAGLTNSTFDYEMIVDLAQGLIACGGNNPDCVVEKTQQNKAPNSGLINFTWKNRSMIPVVEYYSIVDGKLVRK